MNATPQTDEINLLEFLSKISPNQNPYIQVMHYLENLSTPPSLPHWAQITLKFIIACHVLMWLQSWYLLYVRLRTGVFRLITITRLGLWRLDVPNMSGLAYFLYPPLVIADLTLQQKIDHGKRDMTDRIPLFGSFLWVCLCQCISAYWDKRQSALSKRTQRQKLPAYVIIPLNFLFIAILSWVIPFVVYLLCQSNYEYKQTRQLINQILMSLKDLSLTYNPQNFQSSTLLITLEPARQVLTHEKKMATFLRTALMIGLGDLIVLCLLYAPLLRKSFSTIQKQTEDFAFEGPNSNEQSKKLAHIKHRARQEYMTLLIHGLIVYLTALTFIPILIWQTSLRGFSFMRSQKWATITQIGMHGPFAITGNVIVFLLNLQARRLLDSYFIQKNLSSTISKSPPNPIQLDLCGGSTNYVDLDTPPSSATLFEKILENK
ncbi:hypothetical protein O181_072554 [Austropuccinia psidii MF-1]|uniref:Uncharacterized protein n=1 Tax=Austropuccinia psidii MF-1 TaxID=1389203 RepID=A0A9Q3IBL6_9BASI|nr:hypothetical protein [Austropuccinia psidii MF-1]